MSKSINSSAYSSANSLSDLLAIFSNVDSSSWAAKKGKQYTQTELGDYYWEYLSTQDEREYNYWLTQDEREYNEYYYNTYESPSAMVSQYQEAGLNPALMYGTGASTTSTNNSTSSTPSTYDSPNAGHSGDSSFDNLLSVLGTIISAQQAGTSAYSAKQAAEINAYNAETERMRAEQDIKESQSRTTGQDIDNYVAESTKEFRITGEKLANELKASEISKNAAEQALTEATKSLREAETTTEGLRPAFVQAQTAYTTQLVYLVEEQAIGQRLANNFDYDSYSARLETLIDEGQITHVDALVQTAFADLQLSTYGDSGKSMLQAMYEVSFDQARTELKLSEKESKTYALKLVAQMLNDATRTAAMMFGATKLGKGKAASAGQTFAPASGKDFSVNMM